MSLETVDSISEWAKIFVVWLTIAAAFAGWIAWHFGNKATALKDAKEKERREKSAAEIARVNDHAAQAHERAAGLEKEAAQARLELEKLKERHRWRELTQGQVNDLGSSMREFSGTGVKVVASPSTQESEILAKAVSVTLEFAGWKVQRLPGTAIPIYLSPQGIVVQYPTGAEYVADRSKENPEDGKVAKALADKLRSFGLQAIAVPVDKKQGDTLVVVICPK